MQEYRAQLDSDRAARLSQGTNHRSQPPKVKEGGVKKQKGCKAAQGQAQGQEEEGQASQKQVQKQAEVPLRH